MSDDIANVRVVGRTAMVRQVLQRWPRWHEAHCVDASGEVPCWCGEQHPTRDDAINVNLLLDVADMHGLPYGDVILSFAVLSKDVSSCRYPYTVIDSTIDSCGVVANVLGGLFYEGLLGYHPEQARAFFAQPRRFRFEEFHAPTARGLAAAIAWSPFERTGDTHYSIALPPTGTLRELQGLIERLATRVRDDADLFGQAIIDEGRAIYRASVLSGP